MAADLPMTDRLACDPPVRLGGRWLIPIVRRRRVAHAGPTATAGWADKCPLALLAAGPAGVEILPMAGPAPTLAELTAAVPGLADQLAALSPPDGGGA